MVWYDIVILAVILYCGWSGASRGLVSQLAWIAAIILCFRFADTLSPAVEPVIKVKPPLNRWIAMFIVYIGLSLAAFAAARVVNSWVEKARFKDFDKHLGGILGLIKGVIISLIITFFAVTLSEQTRGAVLSSHSGRAACWVLDELEPLTPDDAHPAIREYLQQYRDGLSPLHDDHGGSESSPEEFLPEWLRPDRSDEAGESDSLFPDWPEGDSGGTSDRDDSALPWEAGFGTESGEARSDRDFSQLLSELPAEWRTRLRSQLQQQWDQSTPEQRRKLLNEVSGSAGFRLPDVLSDFLSGQGTVGSDPAGRMTTADLLERISREYPSPERIIAGSREFLRGVPANVQEAVIADWYSDIVGNGADPDTGTNADTRLDVRIRRQLDNAGYSLSRLPLELQQRLGASR